MTLFVTQRTVAVCNEVPDVNIDIDIGANYLVAATALMYAE